MSEEYDYGYISGASITAVIIGAILFIFATYYVIQLISGIASYANSVTTYAQPQIQWTIAWTQDFSLVKNYLVAVLTNPYAIAVIAVMGFLITALTYMWYMRGIEQYAT